MASSPVFERCCSELGERTSLDRMEVRGTVRLALKAGGLDPKSVDAVQMSAVLRRLLPAELEARGVESASAVCESIASAVASVGAGPVADRTGSAAATMERLGG